MKNGFFFDLTLKKPEYFRLQLHVVFNKTRFSWQNMCLKQQNNFVKFPKTLI